MTTIGGRRVVSPWSERFMCVIRATIMTIIVHAVACMAFGHSMYKNSHSGSDDIYINISFQVETTLLPPIVVVIYAFRVHSIYKTQGLIRAELVWIIQINTSIYIQFKSHSVTTQVSE